MDQFRGAYEQGLLAQPADYTGAADIGRGILYSPFDLIGAPVDLANMALQPFGLGSQKPFGGSEYLIDKYADLGDYLGVNYQRPTNSTEELVGRIAGGVFAPTGGAATFGRAVDMTTDAAKAYAAGAPARVAERAGGVQLNTGFDPTAPIDNMIVRRMGDNGGPAMQVEAPVVPVRDIDDLGFYSQALEAAQNLPQAKGTGQQIEKMLIKAGVKPDEIAFTPGLRGLLDQPQVTQDEVVGLLESNRIRPEETVFYGGEESFSGMNFPAEAETLDAYKAFGSDYVNEQADELMFYNTEYFLDSIGDIPKKTQYGEIPETKEQITQALLDENIDDLDVNTEMFLRQKAEKLAIDQYNYDPVVRLQDPDTGYEIVGSDEMGYTINDDGGKPIDPRGNDIPYSLGEARIQAENHAMDRGLVGYSGGETRFSENTEPHGTNYREMLLQVPEYEGMKEGFTFGSHFDEPNVVVHTRTKDRKMAKDAGETLYVEELQSDWGQQGRKLGFGDGPSEKEAFDLSRKLDEYAALKNERSDEFISYLKNHFGEGVDYTYSDIQNLRRTDDKLETLYQNRQSAQRMYDDAYEKLDKNPLEKAPFVGNSAKFAEVGIKRLLTKAVEEGKSYVSFSSGDIQYDRWSEEGLIPFYDKIIPKAAEKVAKRFDPDAKVGPMQVRMDEQNVADKAERLTIEITPKMREALKKGVPLFSAGGLGLLASGEQMSQDRVQPKGIMF